MNSRLLRAASKTAAVDAASIVRTDFHADRVTHQVVPERQVPPRVIPRPERPAQAVVTTVFLVSGTSTSITDWNAAANTMETIAGGGGGGTNSATGATGGGGGAYSKSVNQALSSTTPTYQVGAGGASTANGMLARCCGRCCQAGHHRSDLHAIRRRRCVHRAQQYHFAGGQARLLLVGNSGAYQAHAGIGHCVAERHRIDSRRYLRAKKRSGR